MSFLHFAKLMYPFWLFGGLMFWAVRKSSFKDLLKINKKSLLKWSVFLIILSIYRFFTLKLAISHHIDTHGLMVISKLPLGATLFTPWEDFCHDMPLAILSRFLGKKKRFLPLKILAMLAVSLSFGAGHIYQGIFTAMLLCLYVPLATRFGEKRGFGTLAIAHVLYDFITILTIRLVLCI